MKYQQPFQILVILLFAVSCHKGEKQILLPTLDTFPREIVKKLNVLYTESGQPKMKLSSPLAKRYVTRESEKLIMPEGIALLFYDSVGEEYAKLTARYAERLLNEKKTILRYEVIIETADKKKLTTEELIWDENQHKIFSNLFVRIVTPDKIIWGDGFESDERFEKYVILHPKGEIHLNELK